MKRHHQTLLTLATLALLIAGTCWIMSDQASAQADAYPPATPSDAEQIRELRARVGRLVVLNAELEVRVDALERAVRHPMDTTGPVQNGHDRPGSE